MKTKNHILLINMIINNFFALNHILSPKLNLNQFFQLSRKLSIKNIEIRNDLPNISLNSLDPISIKNLASEFKINILSINALQKFNIWNEERKNELLFLCKFAKKCECEGIVLVPLNTGEFTNRNERLGLLKNSIIEINLILNDYGLVGYIEPLGFKMSSLRLKSEVAEAIDKITPKYNLKILHDTFHHYIAREDRIFPNLTGLVHISGISNAKLKISEMSDDHRELIDNNDVLKNVEQIINLIKGGYNKIFSFEPFSKKIQNLSNPSKEILKSINYLKENCFFN